jgi:hypothetical protein
MIAKIRQRTLLAFKAVACGIAAAVVRFREALGRAMVRTSFIIVVRCKRRHVGAGLLRAAFRRSRRINQH